MWRKENQGGGAGMWLGHDGGGVRGEGDSWERSISTQQITRLNENETKE